MPQVLDSSEKQTLTGVKVDLLEIEAVYDLLPGQEVDAWGEARPSLMGSQKRIRDTLSWYNIKGQPAPSPVRPPGVYCGMACSDRREPVLRTFVRSRSVPVHEKWVYIFEAEKGREDRAELKMEAFYGSDGSYRVTDPNSILNNDRPLMGAPCRALQLHRERPARGGWKQLNHFFFLAPYQLSRTAIGALLANITTRTVALRDPFFADVYLSGCPETVTPLVHAEAAGLFAEKSVSYVLHLCDPAKEALRRRTLYLSVLEALDDFHKKQGVDREYCLAKRIESFTRSYPDLREEVEPKLRGYLAERDEAARRLFLILEMLAQDLTRWIGVDEYRTPCSWVKARGKPDRPVVVFYQDGLQTDNCYEKERPDSWRYSRNPFSDLIRYYGEAPDATVEAARRIVAAVHDRLPDSQCGRRWLWSNLPAFAGAKEDASDGGLGLVLDPVKGMSATLGLLLAKYADSWAKRYKADALLDFQNWLRGRWGVELKVVTQSGASDLRVEELRLWKTARQAPSDQLELAPRWMDTAKVAKEVLRALDLGIKAINTAHAIRALVDNPTDRWQWATTLAAITDTYNVFRKLQGVALEVDLYKKVAGIKAYGPLGLATSVISVVGELRGLADASSPSDRAGYAVSSVGAGLSALGSVTATAAMPLAIIALVAVAFQGAGKWIRYEFKDVRRALRNGTFGTFAGLSGLVDKLLMREVDAFWYKGSLERFAHDMEAQHRALDQLVYDFCPRLVNDGAKLVLELHVSNPGQVMMSSRLSVVLTTPYRDASPEVATITPTMVFQDGNPGIGVVALRDFTGTARMGAPGFESPVRTRGHMVADVTLDLMGDGKLLVRRSCTEVMV